MNKELINAVKHSLEILKATGYYIPSYSPKKAIPNAKEFLLAAGQTICEERNRTFQWLDEYNKIALWLESETANGILLMGSTGNGKTLAMDVIALAYLAATNKVFQKVYASDITSNQQVSEILQQRLIAIDDLGAESKVKDYGTQVQFVERVMDAIEGRGTLAIMTTNFDADTLRERYGERVFDRIKGNFQVVAFRGASMRACDNLLQPHKRRRTPNQPF